VLHSAILSQMTLHVRLAKLSVDIWIFWAFVAISLCDQLEVPKMYRIVCVFVIMKCIMSVVKKVWQLHLIACILETPEPICMNFARVLASEG